MKNSSQIELLESTTEQAPAHEEKWVAHVALNLPLRQAFSYSVPDELTDTCVPGARVLVPFGRRKEAGVVLSVNKPEAVVEGSTAKKFQLKSIASVLDELPLFPEELLQFLVFAADYYLHPIGEVFHGASPPLLREEMTRLRDRGLLLPEEKLKGKKVGQDHETWITLNEVGDSEVKLGAKEREVFEFLKSQNRRVERSELSFIGTSLGRVLKRLEQKQLLVLEQTISFVNPFFREQVDRDQAKAPSMEQERTLFALRESLQKQEAQTFLLHGVTGSGKTEVYLEAIRDVLAQGKSALVLVPEIALTPQAVSRFRARFGDELAVLHSELTDKERARAWHGVREGKIRLVVGARSALFAPLQNLGIVVVDEEHDPSYKQEEGFRYNARDMAILRAHRAGAICVLGSATPSLESYAHARSGRYRYLSMKERATRASLPEVELIDLAQAGKKVSQKESLFSFPLIRAIEQTLAKKEQVILFLNRRGFAPSARCADCGHMEQCPACSTSLTMHQARVTPEGVRAGVLMCHSCDFQRPIARGCSLCKNKTLVPLGLGTERVEEELNLLFPNARMARLDRDVAQDEGVSHVLARMKNREADILVGTQMVTKGHDLEGVTLVGVLLADQSLIFPDFRAGERTFQLLTQVAGRAGRALKQGGEAQDSLVLFQSYQPTNEILRFAQKHDYEGFAEYELVTRKELNYPPYGRLVAVRVDAADEKVARGAAEELASIAKRFESIEVLGPAPAPVAKVRGRFRYRFLLRGNSRTILRRAANDVLVRIERGLGAARASIDIDPISMM